MTFLNTFCTYDKKPRRGAVFPTVKITHSPIKELQYPSRIVLRDCRRTEKRRVYWHIYLLLQELCEGKNIPRMFTAFFLYGRKPKSGVGFFRLSKKQPKELSKLFIITSFLWDLRKDIRNRFIRRFFHQS